MPPSEFVDPLPTSRHAPDDRARATPSVTCHLLELQRVGKPSIRPIDRHEARVVAVDGFVQPRVAGAIDHMPNSATIDGFFVVSTRPVQRTIDLGWTLRANSSKTRSVLHLSDEFRRLEQALAVPLERRYRRAPTGTAATSLVSHSLMRRDLQWRARCSGLFDHAVVFGVEHVVTAVSPMFSFTSPIAGDK